MKALAVKIWRAPLLHFLLLGAALFAADGVWRRAPGEAAAASLRVPAAQITRLEEESRRLLGRPPTAAELAAGVADWIDEELLFRRALDLGWDRSDPVVQQRLLRNMRFLGEPGDEEQLLQRAYALGMERHDLVVRRRLVERAKLAVTGPARATEPAPGELEALLREQGERFRLPSRVRASQVFLSRDRRGDRLRADAGELLAELVANRVSPARAARYGDPSLLPNELPLWPEPTLAARFGDGFARDLLAVEPGSWQGPVESSYGLHLVWVHEREASRIPELSEVRALVENAWRNARARAALRDALEALRRDVVVRVAGSAP